MQNCSRVLKHVVFPLWWTESKFASQFFFPLMIPDYCVNLAPSWNLFKCKKKIKISASSKRNSGKAHFLQSCVGEPAQAAAACDYFLHKEAFSDPKQTPPPFFFSLSESFITDPVRNKLGSICTTAPRKTSTTRTAGCELPFVSPPHLLWNCVCCTTVVVFVSAATHLSLTPGWQWQSVVLGRGKEVKRRLPVKDLSCFFYDPWKCVTKTGDGSSSTWETSQSIPRYITEV